jgi:endonuclease III
VDAVERAIEDNVPAEFQRHAHHWLILHGRYTCVARKPKCARLPDPRSLRLRGQDAGDVQGPGPKSAKGTK